MIKWKINKRILWCKTTTTKNVNNFLPLLEHRPKNTLGAATLSIPFFYHYTTRLFSSDPAYVINIFFLTK